MRMTRTGVLLTGAGWVVAGWPDQRSFNLSQRGGCDGYRRVGARAQAQGCDGFRCRAPAVPFSTAMSWAAQPLAEHLYVALLSRPAALIASSLLRLRRSWLTTPLTTAFLTILQRRSAGSLWELRPWTS